MPRARRTDRPIEKKINLPESLVVQVELFLYSPMEGRVPYGKWADYMQGLIEADLQQRKEQTSAGSNQSQS